MTAPSVCFLHNTPLSARHRGIQKTWRRCTSSSTRQAKTAVWFATEDLEPGALIVNVHDLMAMTKPHHRNATEAQVHAAITHLPPADHVRLRDLHDGHRSLPSRLPRIDVAGTFRFAETTTVPPGGVRRLPPVRAKARARRRCRGWRTERPHGHPAPSRPAKRSSTAPSPDPNPSPLPDFLRQKLLPACYGFYGTYDASSLGGPKRALSDRAAPPRFNARLRAPGLRLDGLLAHAPARARSCMPRKLPRLHRRAQRKLETLMQKGTA